MHQCAHEPGQSPELHYQVNFAVHETHSNQGSQILSYPQREAKQSFRKAERS